MLLYEVILTAECFYFVIFSSFKVGYQYFDSDMELAL